MRNVFLFVGAAAVTAVATRYLNDTQEWAYLFLCLFAALAVGGYAEEALRKRQAVRLYYAVTHGVFAAGVGVIFGLFFR
jgi:hypothetical protein